MPRRMIRGWGGAQQDSDVSIAVGTWGVMQFCEGPQIMKRRFEGLKGEVLGSSAAIPFSCFWIEVKRVQQLTKTPPRK
ncbi:hypothetical protein V6N12_000720 [Hibiscus sabdariffa]|uniref:Uncharacterized protein n=1 Tax=Hibiscus sabdariffa TaxID=183260 RepID=A0ABR2BX94_9ROSI